MTNKHPGGRADQHLRCPEAEYWKIGEVVMIGKGNRAALFVVVGRTSRTSVIVRYRREMKPK